MRFIGWLKQFFANNSSYKVKIVYARGVNQHSVDSKAYNYRSLVRRYKGTWRDSELRPYVNGKKVRFWLLIHSADDNFGDEYIPIFYKRKLRKRR